MGVLWPKELKRLKHRELTVADWRTGGTKGVTHLPGKNGHSFRVYDCPCPGDGWGEHLRAPTGKIYDGRLGSNLSKLMR